MKTFIVVLVLIFSLQSLSKAEGISEFEIEGMSIGDSLLKYMNKKEINENILNYFNDKRKYYIVGKTSDLNVYEQVEIYLKSDDETFQIRTLGGFVTIGGDKCTSKQKEIDNEFNNLFPNLKSYKANLNHVYDKSRKSKQKQTVYVFGESAHKDDHIRTECTEWSEKIKNNEGWPDSLTVVAMTSEILKWIESGYK